MKQLRISICVMITLITTIALQGQAQTPPGSELPTGHKLNQNYPNPFNPATTISYKLPKESFVSLEVFNVVGEHVATLIQERQSPGQHSVIFTGSSFSSGIYFYKMRADNFIAVKKNSTNEIRNQCIKIIGTGKNTSLFWWKKGMWFTHPVPII